MATGVEFLDKFIELVTNAIKTINSDHAYIHKGYAFTLPVEILSLTNGSKYYISIEPPAGAPPFIHWRPAYIGSIASACKIRFYENQTYTGGTAAVPLNMNRNISRNELKHSKLPVKTNVTCVPKGAPLRISSVGSGGIPTVRSGGGSASEHEIVLLSGEKYILEIQNVGGSTTDVVLALFWYEEPKGVS